MIRARIKLFAALSKEEKMKLTFRDFTVSEIEELINETPMKEIDKKIATMRFTKRLTVEEIASLTSYDERTIIKRLKKISNALKETCVKIFIDYEG